MAEESGKHSILMGGEDDARLYWLEEGWKPGGFVRQVDYAANANGVDPLFAGIKIVDCDTHYTEPADLWTANAPAGLKDKMPRVERGADNIDRWYIGDKDFGMLGGNVIGADHNKLLGRLSYMNYDEITAGSYDVKPRLKEMDEMGIWAQICFQNSGTTQAGSLVALKDNDLALTIIQMYNDACADRMKQSGGRINCMATLPYWDKDIMNAEMRRIVDLGIKGVVLPDRPERLSSNSFLGADGKISPFWEEAFDICNATGLSANFHLNSALDASSAIWDNMAFDQRLPTQALLAAMGTCATMMNFMVSGLLDKYTELKIALTESGIGWVPFAVEGMEHQVDEYRTGEAHSLQRRPWEYFRKHFWVSWWFETYAPKHMLDKIGHDRIMFETDYPHPTSLYPGVQKHLVETLGDYDYATRKLILQDNASKVYNLKF